MKNNADDPKEGVFSRITKPLGTPKPNHENIPFDKWDWQKEDPAFYESFMRLPDSKDQ